MQIWAIAFILLTMALGYAKLRQRYRASLGTLEFLCDYLNKFQKFLKAVFEEHRVDNELYTWLTMNVPEAQRKLGSYGIVGFYHLPYGAGAYTNYPIVINTLPKLAQGIASEADTNMSQDAFLRCIGDLTRAQDHFAQKFHNPLTWFREGMQLFLLTPFYILHLFGLTGTGFIGRIDRSRIFNLISGVVALIAFFSAIVTIVVGFEPFVAILQSLFQKFARP